PFFLAHPGNQQFLTEIFEGLNTMVDERHSVSLADAARTYQQRVMFRRRESTLARQIDDRSSNRFALHKDRFQRFRLHHAWRKPKEESRGHGNTPLSNRHQRRIS